MNHFSILILTIGAPGSGKSTWVSSYKKSHPCAHVISSDEIRKELTGTEQCIDPSFSPKIHEEVRRRVKKIIDDPASYGGNNGLGPEIIVDSTNCELEEWKAFYLLGATIRIAKIFDVIPEECEKRIKLRDRKVPLTVIESKYDSFKKNQYSLPFFFNLIWN